MYVLRIHRPCYHSKSAIASELLWLLSLKDFGIHVPMPIIGLNGKFLQVIHHNIHGSRYVVLFHWINGNEPKKSDLATSFKRLGKITAKLHVHSSQWLRPIWFNRPIWTFETMLSDAAIWGKWQDAPYLDKRGISIISSCTKRIKVDLCNYKSNDSTFGLIHADLRLTNLLIEGDHTYVIDFDDCGFSWLMHDLAAAMSFFEHDPNLLAWIINWLQGYITEKSLTKSDIEMIPTFILQRRVQLLAWTGTHFGVPQVNCLGSIWVDQTIELCNKYLNGNLLPELKDFISDLQLH